jgi:hypothetical protein
VAGPDLEELRERIRDASAVVGDPFALVRDVAHAYALVEASADSARDERLGQARDLIIRLLDHRDELGSARPVLDALLARVGLFPYMQEDQLSGRDLLAYEAHRPLASWGTEEFIWHRDQARAYALLADGKSVILSAPTSFGKSRIIDGLVATGRFRHTLVVVPTIALIDEARRRLTRQFGRDYKIVTHASQAAAERTIYVLTQERVLEFEELPELDLFVVDEFYKLALDEDNPDRSRLLNQALYKLLQTSTQFYLLGPNIGGIGQTTLDQLDCVYLDSWDTTVAVDIHQVPRGKKRERLVEVCRDCAARDEQTLVFCSGPARAESVGILLAEAGLGRPKPAAVDAADWLSQEFHPQWRLARALQNGVGIHHGRLPRAIGHYLVSAFDAGEVNFLVCTSTLIEGVNTKAKNIVVYDSSINRRPIDLFTFNNIRGRSGRMFEHITGRVYLFSPQPDPPLQEIDFPVLAQPEDAPPELYIGMDPDDLGSSAKHALDAALADSLIAPGVIEANPAVGIEDQLKLARGISELDRSEAGHLAWTTAYPRKENLEAVWALVWRYVAGEDRRRWPFGAVSLRALPVWISQLESGHPRDLIEAQLRFYGGEKLDQVLLNVLQFQRNGLAFEVPKWLKTVDRLQRELLPRRGLRPGDYSGYLTRIENLFLPHPLGFLDEYGLPPQLAQKLDHALRREGDELDDVLGRLVHLDVEALELAPFERRLLKEARTDLGVLPAA